MSDLFSTNEDVPAAPADFDRRQLLARLAALGIGGIAFQRALAASVSGQAKVTAEMIRSAQWIADIELTEAQQAEVAKELNKYLEGQRALLQYAIDADVSPAIAFVPHFFVESNAIGEAERKKMFRADASAPESLPDGIDDPLLPFASIAQLAKGLRQKRWSSQQLTSLYLDRLAKYDPVLRCVVQRTEDLAMQQAKRADRELQEGRDRGPLHGIPWGAKDIIAVPPFRTTWGAKPYREKVRPNRATVYDRLQDAGAVLLGKLSVGTLAWGDIWHEGMTRNPWNVAEGSSGSSAGSCAATVAGLCGFAIGSETLGSIVSPTQRCRVTGLRPTFGRVSRYGCMTLSWTMDKVGPIGRTVEDCALIFAAIAGSDGRDPTVVDRPSYGNLPPHLRKVNGRLAMSKDNSPSRKKPPSSSCAEKVMRSLRWPIPRTSLKMLCSMHSLRKPRRCTKIFSVPMQRKRILENGAPPFAKPSGFEQSTTFAECELARC